MNSFEMMCLFLLSLQMLQNQNSGMFLTTTILLLRIISLLKELNLCSILTFSVTVDQK